MAAAVVQTSGLVTGANPSLSLPSTAAGNLITICVVNGGTTLPTVSDGVNTYTQIETVANVQNRTTMFYAYNIAGGSLTITVTDSQATTKAEAIEWSGVVSASDPNDQHTNSSGATNAPATGSITTTGTNGDLVVAAFCQTGTGGGGDPPTGFTTAQASLGVSPSSSFVWLTAASTGTYTPVWSSANSNRWTGCIASFALKASTPSGAIAATLAPVTASATGSSAPRGDIAATLAVVTASATGSESVPGSIAASLAPVTADSSGGIPPSGAIAVTLAALSASMAGSPKYSASIAVTLPSVGVAAIGSKDSFVSARIYIDWAGNGISAPTPEAIDDVSSYVVGTISIRRGRAKITDEIAAGTATFTLRNTDGRFTLLNTSSPLYPYNGYPARYCEINVSYNGTTYPLISGTVSQDSQDTFAKTVTFSLVDHFERFRLKLSSLAIQTGKRVDELLTAILDDTDVADPYPKVFDTAPETIGYFTDHNRRLNNALLLAAAQDPGGMYFVDRSGNHRYHNRHHAALATTAATFTGNFDSLDPQVRQEDLADTVRATYPALTVTSTFEAVYTQNIFVACPPGTTTKDFEINASGVTGASSYVTPLTATTDFVANTESNGSGVDKTGQVTITVGNTDSNGGTLTIVNADSSYVYLTSLQVRGYALRQSEITNAFKAVTTSPVITGQNIRKEFEFLDDPDVVRAWVNREGAVRSGMHVRPILKFAPDTDALMAIALASELNNKVQVTDATATWLTYVDGKFTVQGIELNINAPDTRRPPVEATWKLFDAQMSGINQFMISPDVGTARSSIAPDSNYSTYDWVAV